MPDAVQDGLPPDDLSEIAALFARSYLRLRKSRSLALDISADEPQPSPETGLASPPDQSVHVSVG